MKLKLARMVFPLAEGESTAAVCLLGALGARLLCGRAVFRVISSSDVQAR